MKSYLCHSKKVHDIPDISQEDLKNEVKNWTTYKKIRLLVFYKILFGQLLSDDKYITTKDEWLTSNYVIRDSFWVQDKDWC